MLNYYRKFLPNLSTCLAPLYKLLQRQIHYNWGHEQKEAFKKAKDLLTSSDVLTHYDTSKPLVLACDVSPYGVGGCTITSAGTRRAPDCICPMLLSPSRKNYSQIDKEVLAIVFGVKHFHQYLFGRFAIKSDHKPLQHLFGEKKGIPAMASVRVQHWALTLSAYDYRVPGKEHANADMFSHLLPVQPKEVLIFGSY